MIPIQKLTEFIAYDTFEKFKYDLRICLTNKMYYESTSLNWIDKDNLSLICFTKILKLFCLEKRFNFIEKFVDRVDSIDYFNFEELCNNYNKFKTYRSYQKHYKNCGISLKTMFKFIHTEPNETTHIIEDSDRISYHQFNGYAIQHSNKFLNSLINKHIWKVLINK